MALGQRVHAGAVRGWWTQINVLFGSEVHETMQVTLETCTSTAIEVLVRP